MWGGGGGGGKGGSQTRTFMLQYGSVLEHDNRNSN